MKKIISITLTAFLLTACASVDLEHRKQAELNLFEGKCPSGEYILGVANTENKAGWKSQNEFLCKGGALAKKRGSLDGKTYTKSEMIKKGKEDPFIHNIFYP